MNRKWLSVRTPRNHGLPQHIISQKKWLPGKSVLDIGTGSGVLCFVADLCGSQKNLGVEIDKDCLINLAENHEQNPPNGNVNFLIGTPSALKDTCRFDLIVMNMLMTESEPLLETVSSILAPGGILIRSGILKDEKDEAINSTCRFPFRLIDQSTENEWWCGTFSRVVIEALFRKDSSTKHEIRNKAHCCRV